MTFMRGGYTADDLLSSPVIVPGFTRITRRYHIDGGPAFLSPLARVLNFWASDRQCRSDVRTAPMNSRVFLYTVRSLAERILPTFVSLASQFAIIAGGPGALSLDYPIWRGERPMVAVARERLRLDLRRSG